MNYSLLKKELHIRCQEIVQQRIAAAKQAMDFAQESANQEEKSSAGDKYETGRAMAQISRDQAAEQLDEAVKLKKVLDQIDPHFHSTKVELGSLVATDKNRYYISISAGKIEMNNEMYFAISPQTPIGKLMMNHKVNEVFTFNLQQQTIISIH